MYDPKSKHAEDFINHEEIMETLDYARKNKTNRELIGEILEKAKKRKGLSHREAAVLLDCELDDKNQEIFTLAEQIKKDFYGNRIVMFAPLYLSNYCVNGCLYCPYHLKNKHIARKKLTQDEIRAEVTAFSLCGQIPAYFCVAQSAKIYNKLNLPISMVIYPYQNVNLKYEFGWIKKNQTELTRVERTFISEIMRLFR